MVVGGGDCYAEGINLREEPHFLTTVAVLSPPLGRPLAMSASTSNATNPSTASSDAESIPEDLDVFVKELMDNMVRH
jgi:hypothetical protein